MREWFQVTNAAPGKGGGEILIYGVIGRSSWGDKEGYVPAKEFIGAIDKMIAAGPGDVHIRINSPGGDVWDGTAIYNGILKHKARCYCTVEGVAFSMASVIALAGRECRMYDTAQFMIHNPRTWQSGEEKDFEQTLRGLKTAKAALMKAYTGKSGKSAQEVSDAMSATTWMTADEAKEFGFVDVVLTDEAPSIAACFDVASWQAYYEGREAPPWPTYPPCGSATCDSGGDEAGTQRREGAKVTSENGRHGEPLSELENSLTTEVHGNGTEEKTGGGVPAQQAQDGQKEQTMKPSIGEIEKACPGASAEFVVAQAKACDGDENRTIADVMAAYIVEQGKELASVTANLSTVREKVANHAETPPVTVPGVAPLSASGGSDGPEGDALEQFEDAVSAFEAKKMTRAQAIRAVVNGKPELHKAYLAAYNAQHGRTIN